jgi:DNA-binding CsgD family transcriptional regulator
VLVEPVEHALLGEFAGHRLAVVASALLLSEARERRPWHERGEFGGLAGEKLLAVRVGDIQRRRNLPNADALLAVGELPGIASFQALLRADAATAATAAAHPAAERARAAAEAALRDLGAGMYAARLLPSTADAPAADPLAALSDRERDVVTLLLEGLSYAQIARELYVTRSTVAFHLSNAYAKTGTTSRHELVQLVRTA